MNYKYSLDSKLYNKEINYFLENNTTSRNSKIKSFLISLTVAIIALVVILIKRISENKYNDDIMYIFLEHIIILIIGTIILWIYAKLYFKFTINRVLIKYWKEKYVHELDIEDEKIYYSGPNNKKIELNNSILKEVIELDSIIGIICSGRKRFRKGTFAIIIVPKNIFKSEEELSSFKNVLKNKLEK